MVRNAGLVLLQGYLIMLFQKLGLLTDQKFNNEDAREAATHYLHYLVTGHEISQDPDLVLNKLLCGMELSHEIEYGINISNEKKQLIETLIRSVMTHWPECGSTSIAGFRGNWLVRNGLLVEQEDKWELMVERKPYDALLQHSPFSYSVIKFPWMPKPLHVNWFY